MCLSASDCLMQRDSLTDIRCRSFSIRQRMQEFLCLIAGAGVFLLDIRCRRFCIRQRMQESLLSDSWCRCLLIRQQMQDTLFQTAGAMTLIRQQVQESLYQTADAGDSLSDSECRRFSIRLCIQLTLYQTVDAEISLSDIGCWRLSDQTADSWRLSDSLMQKRLYWTSSDAGVSILDNLCGSLSIRHRMQKTL